MANTGRFIGGISFGVFADTAKLNTQLAAGRRSIAAFVGSGAKMLGLFGVGGAVATGITKAAVSFESLNRAMMKSIAIMGDVSSKMRTDLTKGAIEVARVTNSSAAEAAQAYQFLASAGYDASQSLKAMPQIAKFAQAGQMDLASATNYAADAQGALAMKVKDADQNLANLTRVTDVLTAANNLANGTVEDFSKALTNGTAVALKIANKEIEEGVAVLMAFADQGVKAEEAGTAFGIVMRDLQTKAIENADAFKKAGVAVFNSAGDMRNMADIVEDLENRLFGLSDEGKKAALMQLGFADKSVRFQQALIGTSEKIREYEAALKGAGGSTADVASKMMTPLETAMNQLKGAFDDAAQAMGPLVDKAAKLVQYVADIMNANVTPDATQSSRKRAFAKGSLAEFDQGFAMIKQGNKSGALSAGDHISNMLNYWTGGLLGSEMASKVGPGGFKAQGRSTGHQGPFEGAGNALREKFMEDYLAMGQAPGPRGAGRFSGVSRALGTGINFLGNQLSNANELGAKGKANAMTANAANLDKLKGMFGAFMESDVGVKLGRAVKNELATLKIDAGMMGRNLGLDTVMRGVRGFDRTLLKGSTQKRKMADLGEFTAAESGSLASYQQKIKGSQQFEKVEIKQLKVQEKMETHLSMMAKNMPVLSNIGNG